MGFGLRRGGFTGKGVSWLLGGGACREASPWKVELTGRGEAFKIGGPYRVHCP